MTAVTIPNRPVGTDARAIALILADFDAITTVVNGQLDHNNLAANAGITFGQLAPGAGRLTVTDISTNTAAVSGHMYVVGAGAPIVTLPAPAADAVVGVVAAAGPATIGVSGGIIFGKGVPSPFTSLTLGTLGSYVVLQSDGTNWFVVSGEQDTGWSATPLTLGAGWSSGGTHGVRVVGDRVWLRGTLSSSLGGGATSLMGTLAVGFRPPQQVQATQMGFGSQGYSLATNGQITVFSGSVGTNSPWPLDDISFSLT